MKLSYHQEASQWVEALPLGNGRLGAMVFGRINDERIQLNEDTLWSGSPKNYNQPEAADSLAKLRQIIFEEKYPEADQLSKKLLGPYTQSYLPVGDLHIRFSHSTKEIKNYKRILDLQEAIAKVKYTAGEVTYTREVFASYVDQVIVIHLEASQKGKLNFSTVISSELMHDVSIDQQQLILTGQCPEHADPIYHKTEYPIIYSEKGKGDSITFEKRMAIRLVT